MLPKLGAGDLESLGEFKTALSQISWLVLHHWGGLVGSAIGYFSVDQCHLVNQLNIHNFRLHSSPSEELSPSHLLRKSPSPALTVNCSNVSMSLPVKI